MTKTARAFLFDLLETPSPTGSEMPGQRVWAKEVGRFADSVDCDAYGSTWAVLKGKSERIVMLEAHADEIGYVIKQVTKEGFLYLDRVGGSDAATGRGRRLRILGDKGEVLGIIGNTAIHLRKREGEKVPGVHELWVDVGASSPEEVEKMGLRVGHPAVYTEGPVRLGSGRIVSRAVDNRVGGFIIAAALKELAESGQKPAFTVIALNAVQEEIGGHGARMATHRLRPDLCLCTDVTHATDTPGLSHAQHGEVKLGGGPTITHGSANHPLVVQRLMEVAKSGKIPFQHEAAGRFTGTDTDSIFHSREGVPSALISLPLRCMHSVVETADEKDIASTAKLMAAFVRSLKKEDDFHQRL